MPSDDTPDELAEEIAKQMRIGDILRAAHQNISRRRGENYRLLMRLTEQQLEARRERD